MCQHHGRIKCVKRDKHQSSNFEDEKSIILQPAKQNESRRQPSHLYLVQGVTTGHGEFGNPGWHRYDRSQRLSRMASITYRHRAIRQNVVSSSRASVIAEIVDAWLDTGFIASTAHISLVPKPAEIYP